jgi:hypothetical protein
MKRMRRDVRRRLNQFVANPSCEANVRSAVHDIPMLSIAREEGYHPKVGQSPFAIIRGLVFERSLFEDEAAILGRALIRSGVLPASASGLLDLRLKQMGGTMANLIQARDAFYDFLEDISQRSDKERAEIPSIVAAPALQIPGRSILPDGLFAIDLLTIHPAPAPEPITLQIGEIKVYPDRGGYTDSEQLAQARAQSGVYLYGLRLVINKLGLKKSIIVSDRGFLVLTYPGTNLPSVRANEDLKWQAARAEVSFDKLRAAAAQELPLDDLKSDQLSKARLDYIQHAQIHYHESCWQFCERAERCHEHSLEAGDPQILGDVVARLLGPIKLQRALDLLKGSSADNEAEQDFLLRVRMARGEEAA